MPEYPRDEIETTHVSIDAFARLTGLSAATIQRRIRSGHLTYVQPGGPRTRILIPRDALSHDADETASTTSQRARKRADWLR